MEVTNIWPVIGVKILCYEFSDNVRSGEIIVLTGEFYTAEWLIYRIDFWHIRVEWRMNLRVLTVHVN